LVIVEIFDEKIVFVAAEGDISKQYSMLEFLALDMKGKLIVAVHMPQRKGYYFRSFKVILVF